MDTDKRDTGKMDTGKKDTNKKGPHRTVGKTEHTKTKKQT